VTVGSKASEAVGATTAALTEAETLPGLLDVVGEMPPTEQALVRRVAGYNMWLWYRVKDRHVVLVTATKAPPP
jgi:hypothetical protein